MSFNKLFIPSLLLALTAGAATEDDERSDLLSAQSCYDAYVTWRENPTEYIAATRNYTLSRVRETLTDVPTTTLCDGFLRYLEPLQVEDSSLTIPIDEPVTTVIVQSQHIPRPNCIINADECVQLLEDYSASKGALESSSISSSTLWHPPCATYSRCPAEGEGSQCKLFLDASTIYYWPVTMKGDLCGKRTTVFHPEPTRSTVISDNTFVSPSLYLSVHGLWASNHTGRRTATSCGRAETDFYLTLNPTDVSTHSGRLRRNHDTWAQLNLADMNDPTPVTAYFEISEAPDCEAAPESCTDFIEPSRTPVLSVPVQMLRDIDTEFEFCNLHPSSHERIQYITWIPLEPTQDGWSTETAEPFEELADKESEKEEEAVNSDTPSVTQVISITQTVQDLGRL